MAFENSSRAEHHYRGNREQPSRNAAPQNDAALRELLLFLRDSCREIATRLDRYLGEPAEHGRSSSLSSSSSQSSSSSSPSSGGHERVDPAVRPQLDRLLDEARALSHEAPEMAAPELRTRIQAMTAETRSLQSRASNGDDRDTAARILRMLTAIVSEYRPGHVYGLARHHQADWDELGRRARRDLAEGNFLRDNREGDYRDEEAGPSRDGG